MSIGVLSRRVLGALALLVAWTSLPAAAEQVPTPVDAIFQRWPELRRAYFERPETKIATHKFVAMPMPKQCAFLYADAYSTGSMSERDTRDKAIRDCNTKLQQLGALGENYSVQCQCRSVLGKDKYRLADAELPNMVYAPASIFFRDRGGQLVRLNGHVEIGVSARGGGYQVPLTVYNAGGNPVCTGTINATGGVEGSYTMNCLRGQFVTNGVLALSRQGTLPHSVGRATTAQGLPTVFVVGIPAALAFQYYGSF